MARLLVGYAVLSSYGMKDYVQMLSEIPQLAVLCGTSHLDIGQAGAILLAGKLLGSSMEQFFLCMPFKKCHRPAEQRKPRRRHW